jgi:hypothetical protein
MPSGYSIRVGPSTGKGHICQRADMRKLLAPGWCIKAHSVQRGGQRGSSLGTPFCPLCAALCILGNVSRCPSVQWAARNKYSSALSSASLNEKTSSECGASYGLGKQPDLPAPRKVLRIQGPVDDLEAAGGKWLGCCHIRQIYATLLLQTVQMSSLSGWRNIPTTTICRHALWWL